MKDWFSLIRQNPLLALRNTPTLVWVIVMVIVLVSSVLFNQKKSGKSAIVPRTLEGIDTLIPKNYSLIPLHDLENYESLNSLIGSFGLVNLYFRNQQEMTLLATSVKILRAPKNPSQFAVLVPTSEAHHILNVTTPMTALVIHPEAEAGTDFEVVYASHVGSHSKSSKVRGLKRAARPTFNFNPEIEE